MPCLKPHHLTVIKPEDFDLGRCGAPVSPDAVWLDLPTSFVFNHLIPANTIDTELKQALDPRSEFILKYITVYGVNGAPGAFVRFQFPNGRYHSNVRVADQTYAGTLGGERLLIDPVVKCPEASFIGIELENPNGVPSGVMYIFGGVKRIYLR